MVPRYRFLAVICSMVLAGSALAEVVDPIKADLDEAKAMYKAAVEKAKTTLLNACDSVTKAVAQTGDLNAVKALMAEKKAFETTGMLPKAAQLQPAAKEYQRSANQAREVLDRVYEAAVKEYTKALQIEKAEAAKAESQLPPNEWLKREAEAAAAAQAAEEAEAVASDAAVQAAASKPVINVPIEAMRRQYETIYRQAQTAEQRGTISIDPLSHPSAAESQKALTGLQQALGLYRKLGSLHTRYPDITDGSTKATVARKISQIAPRIVELRQYSQKVHREEGESTARANAAGNSSARSRLGPTIAGELPEPSQQQPRTQQPRQSGGTVGRGSGGFGGNSSNRR